MQGFDGEKPVSWEKGHDDWVEISQGVETTLSVEVVTPRALTGTHPFVTAVRDRDVEATSLFAEVYDHDVMAT